MIVIVESRRGHRSPRQHFTYDDEETQKFLDGATSVTRSLTHDDDTT